MKNEIKFSIITPVYNGQKYISRFFKSIKQIDFNNKYFELIIIIDDKNHKIFKIIEKKTKHLPNKKIIINPSRLGPGLSRNKGLNISKGKYILFLDFDDFLKSNALKVLKNSIKNNPDFVGFNFEKKDNKTIKNCRKDFKYISKSKNKRIMNFLMGEIDGSVIFTCIKKQIIIDNKILFEKELHEDIYFIFRVYFYSNKFNLINKSLYIKYNENTSIVNNINVGAIKGYLNQPLRIKKFLIKNRFNFKILEQCYLRGLFGYSGHLILSTLKINNLVIRKENYKLIKKLLSKNANFINYKFVTFKDYVVKIFIEYFNKNRINELNINNFENNLIKINEKNFKL